MQTATYADILCPDWSFHAGCNLPKEPGTLVQLGRNRGHLFEIVAVQGGTAWIREPVTYRNEALVPLHRLCVADSALA